MDTGTVGGFVSGVVPLNPGWGGVSTTVEICFTVVYVWGGAAGPKLGWSFHYSTVVLVKSEMGIIYFKPFVPLN